MLHAFQDGVPVILPAFDWKHCKQYTRAGTLLGSPSLDRSSRDAWVEFEPRTFRSNVPGLNPTSASRLSLSRFGQPGSIPALMLPSGGMTARHQKGVTAELLGDRKSYSQLSDKLHGCKAVIDTTQTNSIKPALAGTPRGLAQLFASATLFRERDGPSGYSANLLTARSVVRTRPLSLDFPRLGLGDLVLVLPSGGMAARQRKGVTAEHSFILSCSLRLGVVVERFCTACVAKTLFICLTLTVRVYSHCQCQSVITFPFRESPPLEVSVGFAQSTGDSLSIRTTLPMVTSAGSRLEMRESILVSPSLSCTSTVDGIDDLDEHLPTTTYVYHHHQRHDVDHHPAGAHAQHHQHSGVNKDLFDSRGPTVTYHHHHHAHHHHHHHLPQTPISASNNVSPPICSPVKPMTLASGSIHNAVSFPEPTTVINLDSLDQNVNHAHCHNHPHYHRHHQGHGLGPHHHHHHHHHIRHHSVTHNHVNTPVNKENTIMTMTNGGETVSKKTTTSVPTTSTRDLKRVMHLSNSKEYNGPAEQNELYSAQAGGAQSMFGSVDRHRANTADSSVGSPFQTGQPTCLVATREPQSDRSRTGHVHPATPPPPPRCSPSSTGKFTISLPTTSPASSVHKKEHGERVMQLQHLLPPEAIQKIRQIWKDIFGAGATRSDDRSLLSLGSISSGPASRVQPGGALREHFARRVRQIVRQYLGPNALVTAKQTRTTTANVSVTVPEAPTEETKPADLFFGPNGRDENVASSGSTVTAPRLSTTPTETTSLSNDNTSGGHLPTVPIPLVTSTCTTTVANVTSPPVVDFKSTSNLSSESRQAYSQLPPSGGPQAPPNMCVTDLQAARRASGNSTCCMLEWLLSEEADLDLLPASFYDAKPGPSSISVATAPSVKPTETGSSALTTANHSVVTANNTGVLPHYSSPFTSYLPPSSVGSASSCDSTSKQPLSIQFQPPISTPTTFCQSVLVSPVTPASLGSDSSRPLLGSPTTTITYPPCPNRDLDQSGPASQPTPNRHTNSVESSPTSSSVAASRSNSLLVVTVTPFRCLASMPLRTGILSSCLSLDRRSRDAEVGFEPRTFRSANLCSPYLWARM
ncbi:hypothetical protein T265_04458 [Opisthorchis viverrini]|uniref:Uncharacterized protein n=1 Tax=Opisthorchis viverrini TaxID=6198 RepID=A0A075AGI9_OPIVI|nr:hypothetical protein T265_04458 [Opisthorchis viverrini]KER28764.1 hypothetical protein T265_04458 [Opisthorchis viverrini]